MLLSPIRSTSRTTIMPPRSPSRINQGARKMWSKTEIAELSKSVFARQIVLFFLPSSVCMSYAFAFAAVYLFTLVMSICRIHCQI